MSDSVRVVEVGPRDGLQNAATILAPADRAELVRRLFATGLAEIEAVSFVRGDRVPQMEGAEEVVLGIADDKLSACSALVLNPRGYDRLVASGLRSARFTFAVSDTFNRRNSNQSTAEGLRDTLDLIRRAAEDDVQSAVVLATSFGCPFEGHIEQTVVLEIAHLLAAAGVKEIVFADTIGVATPRQVRDLVTEAAGFHSPIGVHLHNTRNTGYANAYAALEAGATIFDSSIGGLGGCPFAPGATGNIATEDLVYMLGGDGISTGVDLDALIDTANWLRDSFGLPLDGQLHRVGRPVISPPVVNGTAPSISHE